MALATLADFNMIDETSGATEDWPEQWAAIRKIVWDLAALWASEFTVGTEPDTGLQYIAFGTTDSTKLECRVGTNGTYLYFQANTGTDASPVWATRLSLHLSTGLLVCSGGVFAGGGLSGLTGTTTLSGNLDVDSNNILNVANIAAATINSWDPDSHSARHAVGGSDALSVGTPVDVGAANAAGAATNFPRRDHVHEGVHTIVAGDYVNISPGSGLGDVTVNVDDQTYSLTDNTGTGDQPYGAVQTEADVTTLTALAFPGGGADGTKWYEVSGLLLMHADHIAAGLHALARLYVGVNGNLSDGAGGLLVTGASPFGYGATEALVGVPVGPIPVQPSSGHKIGLSAQVGAIVGASNPGGNTDIKGSAGQFCYLYIKEMRY
jgi:hypothetical protein